MNAINDPEGDFWTQRRSRTCDDDPFRTLWEHDYGRVVHSASFRRLQGKTQIFGTGEHDFYRTRLTHSLEVSQIGVSITKRLHRDPSVECPKKKWLPHPMLMRTICLAHDLGHPPFGHGGEVALNRCMLDHGGFEGNGQTLRIITSLDNSTAKYGMDLTRRAVLGTIKYPAAYDDVVNRNYYPNNQTDLSGNSVFKASEFIPPKCYLDEEEDIVRNWVAKGPLEDDWFMVSNVSRRDDKHGETSCKSLDASIMDLADEIAYGVHDLEDAIALRLIDRHTFCGDCNIRKGQLEPLLSKHFCGEVRKLVDELFGETHRRKQAIGQMVGFFVNAVKIEDEFMFEHPLFQYRAALNCERRNALNALKKIVKEHVTKSLQVQQLEFKGQKIVTELFEAFATDPQRLLESNYYKRIRNSKMTERVVCDYIAGMTDDYAITRYKQLFVPRAGSIFDRL